jgi:hypothetical protein
VVSYAKHHMAGADTFRSYLARLILAHLFFCAAAILFLTAALMVRLLIGVGPAAMIQPRDS